MAPDSPVLPDVLDVGLLAVFCGTAAGNRSTREAAYYAGPGNRFWPILHETGLTPSLIRPANYRLILASGLGLTDLCKNASGSDFSFKPSDFDVTGFKNRIRDHAPAIVAFNGKNAAQFVLKKPYVDFGVQQEGIFGAAVWVLPSTAGTARGLWDERPWFELADAVSRLRGAR